MMYIYHKVPQDMQGDTICPLSVLSVLHPERHREKSKKYEKRTALAQYYIEILDCTWGDVIFMSSVHPSKLKSALEAAGFPGSIEGSFYEVPIGMLERDKLCLMNPQMRMPQSEDFISFSENDLEVDVSREMVHYLAMKKSESRNPLIYTHVQQVLYRGCIDISSVKMITI